MDLERIHPVDRTIEGLDDLQNITALFSRGPALTAWNGQNPVGAGGIIILKPGVGQAWLLPGRELWKSFRAPIRIKCFMWKIIKDYDLFRVHAFADCRNPSYARFLEFLGMHLEGIHRKLGPD